MHLVENNNSISEQTEKETSRINEEFDFKPPTLPLTSNSNTDGQQLDTPRKQFSLHLPLSGNENDNANTLTHPDFTDKRKTTHPRSLSPLKHEQNEQNNSLELTDGQNKENNYNSLDQLSLEYDLKKVEAVRVKMEVSLRNIYRLMIQGPEVTDNEDAARIKLRSNEFSNRFKRNYLYQVQCNINEIEKRLSDKQKSASTDSLAKKVILAHQSCLQTLQVIEKQLPKIRVDSPFNVFNDFFMGICDLTKKFKYIFGILPEKNIDCIVGLCERVMDAMIDLIKVKPCPKKNPKVTKKTKDNLWMYSNKNSWRNKATALANSRFGQKMAIDQNQQRNWKKPNKTKSTHECVINKTMGLYSSFSNELVMRKKSKLNLRKRDPIAEDEIQTMVERTDLNETDNSEIYENLQFDVNPVLGVIADSDQITRNQETSTGLDFTIPILTSTKTQTDPSKSDKELHASNQKYGVEAAKNVALINIKSKFNEHDEISECKSCKMKKGDISSLRSGRNEDVYKEQFLKYKKESGRYKEGILVNITRISADILEDTVQSVVEELNPFPEFEDLVITKDEVQ